MTASCNTIVVDNLRGLLHLGEYTTIDAHHFDVCVYI